MDLQQLDREIDATQALIRVYDQRITECHRAKDWQGSDRYGQLRDAEIRRNQNLGLTWRDLVRASGGNPDKV